MTKQKKTIDEKITKLFDDIYSFAKAEGKTLDSPLVRQALEDANERMRIHIDACELLKTINMLESIINNNQEIIANQQTQIVSRGVLRMMEEAVALIIEDNQGTCQLSESLPIPKSFHPISGIELPMKAPPPAELSQCLDHLQTEVGIMTLSLNPQHGMINHKEVINSLQIANATVRKTIKKYIPRLILDDKPSMTIKTGKKHQEDDIAGAQN